MKINPCHSVHLCENYMILFILFTLSVFIYFVVFGSTHAYFLHKTKHHFHGILIHACKNFMSISVEIYTVYKIDSIYYNVEI